MKPLAGLPPIVDAQARLLVLGSFPSEVSLTAQQYYAHKHNQFWPLLGVVIDVPLAQMDYEQRVAAVRAAGVAIWDVYAHCARQGSLDAAIRDGQPNDFAALLKWAPRLRRVLFNGKTAARFAPRLQALGLEIRVLPSTSPANAGFSFAQKLAAWQAAFAIEA